MKCPIFCSLGFSVGNVIFNEKVSLTNSMGDTNSRELASPTELVRSSHSRVDELPLSCSNVWNYCFIPLTIDFDMTIAFDTPKFLFLFFNFYHCILMILIIKRYFWLILQLLPFWVLLHIFISWLLYSGCTQVST